MKPKHECIYPNGENKLMVPNNDKKGLLCESAFVLVEKEALILKTSWKKSFSYKIKASMSFIQIMRKSLRFPIVETKEIIMWICVYPNKWTLILKNSGKRGFSIDTKASMSFIQIRRMNLWFTIMKRKEIITWIRVYPDWQTNFDSKN